MITDYPLLPFNRWPLPHVRVEVVMMTIRKGALHVLMRREQDGPCAGQWGLPGGFVREQRPLGELAQAIFGEATGIYGVELCELGHFDAPGRDPRGWVMSVAYLGLAPLEHIEAVIAGRDDLVLAEARYDRSVQLSTMTIGDVRPSFAFDHEDIVVRAIQQLRAELEVSPRCLALLPEAFTLLQLQHVHEAILERPISQMPFRKRMQARAFCDGSCLVASDVHVVDGGRPARLYRRVRENH